MLYSHGNGVDIGQLWSLFHSLSNALKTNILCYDYVGYGVNTDSPSEKGCTRAINAGYNYLIALGFKPENILLYGRSIGTGPTIHLAANLCLKGKAPKGVVLESPYTSVFGVASEKVANCSSFVDMFRNVDKIAMITTPIMIFHGTDDQVIPHHHSVRLRDQYKRAAKDSTKITLVSFEGGGHNDLGARFGKKIWTETGKMIHM